MLKDIFKNLGVFGKLLMLFFVFFFFSLLGMTVVNTAFGSTDNIFNLKINQLILSVFTLLLPPIVCGYFWYEKPWRAYSLHRMPSSRQIFLSIILVFSISPFINLLAYINEQMVLPEFLSALEKNFREMEDSIMEISNKMLRTTSFYGMIFNILVMALMPAVSEELFCRGTLQNILSERMNKITAVWIVAVIFSLIHFQMYGFLPRMLMGALLGYLLVWSGSLWLPILAHFTNNAIIVLASFFLKDNKSLEVLENLGKAETWGYGLVSLVVSVWILRMIYKSKANPK